MTPVSVIIPTYNRLEQLQQVLIGLENQTVSPDRYEVLIISDGSTDGTNEFFRTINTRLNIRFYAQSNQGAAAARNIGIAHALGEIILFIDDDVVPIPTLIHEHLDTHLNQGDCVVVIGPMLIPADFTPTPWVRWELMRLVEQYQDMVAGKWAPTPRQFYTGNTSLARHHFETMPAFDTAFRRAEDVELGYRLADRGLKFVFNPNAIGYHYAKRSYNSWLAIPTAYGKNDVIFATQKGQSWLLPKIFSEFLTRHVLIQIAVRACIGRPALTRLSQALATLLLRTSERTGSTRLEDLACSGIFNLLYYQGMAKELGGRKEFFSHLRQATHPT